MLISGGLEAHSFHEDSEFDFVRPVKQSSQGWCTRWLGLRYKDTYHLDSSGTLPSQPKPMKAFQNLGWEARCCHNARGALMSSRGLARKCHIAARRNKT